MKDGLSLIEQLVVTAKETYYRHFSRTWLEYLFAIMDIQEDGKI